MTEAADKELASALPEVIWTCDAHGQLEWVNAGWTELTGLTNEDSRDKRALEAVHPDDLEVVQASWTTALTTSSPCKFEYRIRTRAGEYRWHLAHVTPVKDEAGKVTRWVAAAFDIHERRLIEDALRSSERRFETVFHHNPFPIVVVRESDGELLQVNDAFVALSGFAREELLHHTALELGMIKSRAPLLAAASVRDPAEIPFRTKSGRVIMFSLTITRIDFGGEPCLLTVGKDVTEQRATEAALRLSEAQARARADELAVLMDAVPAAVFVSHDPEGQHLSTNRRGAALLRVEPGTNVSIQPDGTVMKHLVVRVDGVDVAPSDLPVHRAARGIETREALLDIEFDDGTVLALYGSAAPLREPGGEPRGAIGAFVDVTELKRAEAALRDADRRKNEFLALLSHELRNPLSPIITAAEVMELRGGETGARERGIVLRQARHLLRLIDDLLDVSRITRGKIKLLRGPLELATPIRAAVEATASVFEGRRHHLTVDIANDLEVDGDEIRLTQIISNLLTNAARYTPEGGHVTLSAAREGELAVVRVRDDGQGMEPDLLANVFELFVQGEQQAEKAQGGLGIGLSLVRLLTELHGGTVTAASAGLGRGSEFTIRLPALAAGSAKAMTTEVTARAHAHPQRILVVDDNEDAADTVARVLESLGHDVVVAYHPTAALAVATDFHPEVAVLDIGLPTMDGYALGRELVARVDPPPALMALTAHGQDKDRQRSKDAGFTHHLVKPLDIQKLLSAIDDVTRAEAMRLRQPTPRPD